MQKWFILRMGLLFFSLCSVSYPEQSTKTYGQKGDFDFSLGFSGVNTTNYPGQQQYVIGLRPYANHYLFDRIFARYDAGLGFSIVTSSYDFVSFGISPGLAIGYTFNLSEKWYLNVSGGYAFSYTWQKSSYAGYYSGGSQSVLFYPELKYLITERWAIAATTRINSNIPDLISGDSKYLRVVSQLYIGISYIF